MIALAERLSKSANFATLRSMKLIGSISRTKLRYRAFPTVCLAFHPGSRFIFEEPSDTEVSTQAKYSLNRGAVVAKEAPDSRNSSNAQMASASVEGVDGVDTQLTVVPFVPKVDFPIDPCRRIPVRHLFVRCVGAVSYRWDRFLLVAFPIDAIVD